MRTLLVSIVVLVVGIDCFALRQQLNTGKSKCSLLEVEGQNKSQFLCLVVNPVNSSYEMAIHLNHQLILWQRWSPKQDWVFCNHATTTFWFLHLCGNVKFFSSQVEIILYKGYKRLAVIEYSRDDSHPLAADPKPLPTEQPLRQERFCNGPKGDELCLRYAMYKTYVMITQIHNDQEYLAFRWNFLTDRVHCFKVPSFSLHSMVCVKSHKPHEDLEIAAYEHFRLSMTLIVPRPGQDNEPSVIIPHGNPIHDEFAMEQYLTLADENLDVVRDLYALYGGGDN